MENLIPNYVVNPEYLKVFKTSPDSQYSFFWDIICASYAYDLDPASVAYILTVFPNIHKQSRHYASSFSGSFSTLLSRYQDIVELYAPVFYVNKTNDKDFYVWGTKIVWEMKKYPNDCKSWTNSVGVRITEDIQEVVSNKLEPIF
jgi:hypothetical protein